MIELLTQPFGPLAIGLVLLASVGLPTVLVVYWATRNHPIKPVDKLSLPKPEDATILLDPPLEIGAPMKHGWPQEPPE